MGSKPSKENNGLYAAKRAVEAYKRTFLNLLSDDSKCPRIEIMSPRKERNIRLTKSRKKNKKKIVTKKLLSLEELRRETRKRKLQRVKEIRKGRSFAEAATPANTAPSRANREI